MGDKQSEIVFIVNEEMNAYGQEWFWVMWNDKMGNVYGCSHDSYDAKRRLRPLRKDVDYVEIAMFNECYEDWKKTSLLDKLK